MSLYPFADTMTETVCDRFVRAARIRRPLRQLAWRNAVQDAINNFGIRPHAGGSGASKAGYSSRTGTAGENPAFPTNFRPATTAKSEDVSCVVSTSDAASCEGSQGGANSASASADSAVGARRLTPG